MFKHYNYLGFHNPYYITSGGSFIIRKGFPSICKEFPETKRLDIAAVIQVLTQNYMLGDRTIIRGIHKTPWMAKPASSNRDWEFAEVPKHEERVLPVEKIAEAFFDLIQKEILEYVRNVRRVGVLLSGGMDSRIVAGTLDYLIKTGYLQGVQVTALTWGMENSRDVVYAKQIANSLGWSWKHYTVDVNDLRDNIEIAAAYGCEFSPIHLHAMPQIREEKGLDCILAGSYGDSIGRGEYSGVKVAKLKNLAEGFQNVEGILKSAVYKSHKGQINDDIQCYHNRFPQNKTYQQYEQDYQLHYMRRMLNACMAVIDDKIPLYQVFTKPEVFGFMWTMHPQKRNDEIYKIILGYFNKDLARIPWARTGRVYGDMSGTPDHYSQKHHQYAEFISRDLLSDLKRRIYRSDLFSLGIFNKATIDSIFKLIALLPKENNIYLGEKIIWMAALARTIDIFGIVNHVKAESHIKDYLNGLLVMPGKCLAKNTKKILKPL